VLIWIHRSSHYRELIIVSVSLSSTITTVITRGDKTKAKDSRHTAKLRNIFGNCHGASVPSLPPVVRILAH